MLSADAAQPPCAPAARGRPAAALATLLAGTGALAQPVQGAADGAGGAPLAAMAGALLLAIAIAAWALWRLRRVDHEAREARARLTALAGLLDVWQWQTDREHRLVALLPPAGAAAGQWPAAPGAALLWERFGVADGAALRARMQRGDAIGDVEAAEPGGTRRGLLRGVRLGDAAGGFAGYLGTLRELEPASAAAPGDDTERESFSYTVSHDLRAPIRVVEGFTRIVKEDYGRLLDRVGLDHLDRVLAAAARMNSMIDALLALSKLSSQSLVHQPVSLTQLAGFVAEDLRRQSPARRVDLRIAPGMQVTGDPTLLRIVLENLLGNAWKYTGHREVAVISLEPTPGAADTYTVQDNGAGFDMRFADRLFGPFQRLHSASEFPGHGIGLASVQRIVRRHGGEIWAEAEVDGGASFHFTLPQRGAAEMP